MSIGIIAAFLGGVLALLSPCGALLVPAFFAFTTAGTGRLLLRTGVFLLGLLSVLLPIGAGAGLVGGLLTEHRSTVILVSGLLLVGFGVLQVLGIGFDLGARLPGRATGRTGVPGLLSSYVLGAVSGVAGFCTGPILGAVLTMAASAGSAAAGLLLLFVYAIGIAAPMLVIATVWQQLGSSRLRWLRGRTVTIAGREIHTTQALGGLVFIVVGLVFILTNGLIGVPEVLSMTVRSWLQSSVLALPAWANVLIGAGLLIVLWFGVLTPFTAPGAPLGFPDPGSEPRSAVTEPGSQPAGPDRGSLPAGPDDGSAELVFASRRDRLRAERRGR